MGAARVSASAGSASRCLTPGRLAGADGSASIGLGTALRSEESPSGIDIGVFEGAGGKGTGNAGSKGLGWAPGSRPRDVSLGGGSFPGLVLTGDGLDSGGISLSNNLRNCGPDAPDAGGTCAGAGSGSPASNVASGVM